jgi:CheY-like chemotaxis protein
MNSFPMPTLTNLQRTLKTHRSVFHFMCVGGRIRSSQQSEWDFSSTRLREHFGAWCLLFDERPRLATRANRKMKMMKILKSLMQRNSSSASTPRSNASPLICVVDDDPEITALYTALLEGAGYGVKTFNDREEALAVLNGDPTKPDLLITDYVGLSMPVDGFMRRCLAVHPTLRILMASGFGASDAWFNNARPDRFIQKPFTADEFLQEVRAVLTA